MREQGERPILAGIRVVDTASFVAGPAAALVLAEFGAEVIKVEPPGGDGYRRLHALPGLPEAGRDYLWELDSRGKRSLVLDLKDPGERRLLDRLVATADIFVTNQPLPARRRMGLTWEALSAGNPRLIYASLTAFGESGPDSDGTAFDASSYWSRSGLMHQVRSSPDAAPAMSLPGQGDHPTSLALFGAIMLALFERQRTGRGRHVHTSLLANGLWSNAMLSQGALAGAPVPARRPRTEPFTVMVNVYRSSDENWFMLAGVEPDRDWERLLQVIERPDWAADPRFATAEARKQNSADLTALLDRVFATRSWADWSARLRAAQLSAGPVLSTEDAVGSAQAAACGAIAPAPPGAVTERSVNAPIWVDGAAKARPRPAPALDADGPAIRAALADGDSPWHADDPPAGSGSR
ncbi:MAG: CoA transferase [Sneathiellaceae bacterium]